MICSELPCSTMELSEPSRPAAQEAPAQAGLQDDRAKAETWMEQNADAHEPDDEDRRVDAHR